MDCLFCKIVEKEIPANIVYENEHVIAFLDINPDTFGHTLVVPKKHSIDLLEMNYDNNILKDISDVANLLVEKLGADGINLVNNNRAIAGQIIFHTHFHLLPRYENCEYAVTDIDKVMELIHG